MIRAKGALVAAAAITVITQPSDAVAQSTPADPAAVAAYIDTLETLYREGTALGDRIYNRYETIEAFHIGEIDGTELVRRFDLTFGAVQEPFETYRGKIGQLRQPPPTGDRRRDEYLTMVAVAVWNLPPLLAGMMVSEHDLRAAALANDDMAYDRIAADILEQRATLYKTKYLYHAGRWAELDQADPLRDFHQVARGINEAADTTFQVLAQSRRSGAFDPASYSVSLEASLRLIEKGLAGAEAAIADPAWLAADTAGNAGDAARRRDLAMELAQRHVAGARAFVAAARRSAESVRAAADGKARLSGPEMRAPLRRLRLDIEQALADAATLDPIRRELRELERTGAPQ